jgi:hypothetical protein
MAPKMQIQSERGRRRRSRWLATSRPLLTDRRAGTPAEGEAVRNAVAHSGCGRIEVSVDVDDAELRGCVEDDGKGFDPHGEGVRHDDRGDGEPATEVGPWSMRERTEALAGRAIGRLLRTWTGQRGGSMHPIGR